MQFLSGTLTLKPGGSDLIDLYLCRVAVPGQVKNGI